VSCWVCPPRRVRGCSAAAKQRDPHTAKSESPAVAKPHAHDETAVPTGRGRTVEGPVPLPRLGGRGSRDESRPPRVTALRGARRSCGRPRRGAPSRASACSRGGGEARMVRTHAARTFAERELKLAEPRRPCPFGNLPACVPPRARDSGALGAAVTDPVDRLRASDLPTAAPRSAELPRAGARTEVGRPAESRDHGSEDRRVRATRGRASAGLLSWLLLGASRPVRATRSRS